jgi:hypothetical protein
LLITIPFLQAVKLKAISIFSGVSPSQAPKEVKLFINHNAMDFGDAESNTPAQELDLKTDDIKGGKIDLRFVRFQNVRSLHILVKSNQEDEETTRIDSIDIFGSGESRKFQDTRGLLIGSGRVDGQGTSSQARSRPLIKISYREDQSS